MRLFTFFMLFLTGLAFATEQEEGFNGLPDEPVTPPVGEFTAPAVSFPVSANDDYFLVNELSGSASKQFTRTAISDNNVTIVVWSDFRSGYYNVYAQLIGADGSKIDSNIIVPVTKTYVQNMDPYVVANGDRFLVVWRDSRTGYRTYGQFIRDDGTLVGENFKITDDDSRGSCYYPSVTTNGSEYLVVWSDTREGGKWDVYAQLLDSGGAKIDTNFRVNGSPQSTTKYYPRAAMDSTGNMAFVWYEYDNGNYNAAYAQISASGVLLTDEGEVLTDDSTVTRSYSPDVAVTDSGFIAVWYQVVGAYRIVGQLFDWSGQRVDSNMVMSAQAEGSEYDPSVSSLPGGEYLLTWRARASSYTMVKGRVFKGRKPLTDDFYVSGDEDEGSKAWAHSRANAAGFYAASWIKTPRGDYKNSEIWAVARDIDGEALWPQQRVSEDENSSSQYYPDLALSADGSFKIIWADYRDRNVYRPYFQGYSPDAAPVDSNRTLEGSTYQSDPQIAAGPQNTYLLSWRQYYNSTYEIMGALIADNGDTLKGPFLISTNTMNGYPSYNNIASDGQKHFLVSWSQRIGSYNRIFSQLLDSQGNLIGGNIQVSQDTTVSHYYPAGAVDTSGAFAVAWNYYASLSKIYLQRYNSQRQALDSALHVGDFEQYVQYQPALAANSNGDAVVLYREYHSNKYGLYYQKYKDFFSEASFSKEGNSRAVWDDGLQSSTNPAVAMDEEGNIAFAWQASNNESVDVFATVLLSGDTVAQQPFVLMYAPESREESPDIAIQDGFVYATWQSNYGFRNGWNIYGSVTSVADVVSAINERENSPAGFELGANYPNPFNPVTRIVYKLAAAQKVTLKVYDISGRLVRTLVDGRQPSGAHTVDFNAEGLASGLYFYTLTTSGGMTKTRKMILLR